jgi:hypothetical protein
MQHVVFLQRAAMDAFIAGTKRVEFRVSRRRQPWLHAQVGDLVLLKRVAGNVEMAGTIVAVDSWRSHDDTARNLTAFIERWRHRTSDDGAYLLSKPGARYAAAIEIGDLRPATLPPESTPRNVRAGWVVSQSNREGRERDLGGGY